MGLASDSLAGPLVASMAHRVKGMDESHRPEWWQRARVLEEADELEAAERAITEAIDHIGASASVAELYAGRMRRLASAGNAPGAAEARIKAEQWIRWYASQATSGGEGAALSVERDRFLASLDKPTPGPLELMPRRDRSPLQRFLRSMTRDIDTWREGVGYDLQALAEASPDERASIEAALLAHRPQTWHDIEALSFLDTQPARQAILDARHSGDPMVVAAVTRFASPGLLEDEARTSAIVKGLLTVSFYGGLTQVLDQVEDYHPQPVQDALLHGVLHREGEVAVHFAAMLMYVHGHAARPFDWNLRPFFLQFNTEDPSERAAAFHALCLRLEVDASRWLTE